MNLAKQLAYADWFQVLAVEHVCSSWRARYVTTLTPSQDTSLVKREQNSVWPQFHYSTHYSELTLHYITTSSSKIDSLNMAHIWPESECIKLHEHIPDHLTWPIHTTAALVSSAILLNYSTDPVSSFFNIIHDPYASCCIWFHLHYTIPNWQDTSERMNKTSLCLLVSLWTALSWRYFGGGERCGALKCSKVKSKVLLAHLPK